MINLMQIIAPVFLILLLGYLIALFRKIELQPFIDLIVYISGPCLTVSSLATSKMGLYEFSKIGIAAGAIILSCFFIIFLILKYTKSNKIGLYLPMAIGNTGFLGFPVVLFAYGLAGLSMAVVFDAVSSLILFSLGIYLVHHKNEIKEIFKIPLIYAVILGLFINFSKYKIPDPLLKPIEMIGMITIPIALLILGYRLREIKLSFFKLAFFAALFRIIGGFLIALFFVWILSIGGLPKNVILLEAAMPSAVMSMILTHKYNRDSDLVASIVLISTLISLISVPLIIWLLS